MLPYVKISKFNFLWLQFTVVNVLKHCPLSSLKQFVDFWLMLRSIYTCDQNSQILRFSAISNFILETNQGKE